MSAETESTPDYQIVEFTQHELALIRKSLPADADPRRLKLLSRILRDWAAIELRDHLARPTSQKTFRERRRRMAVFGRCVRSAMKAFAGLDGTAQTRLALELVRASGAALLEPSHTQLREARLRLEQERKFLGDVAAAADRASVGERRGHPRSTVPYLVLSDLAALFEYLTGIEARRQVDRHDGNEIGPFYEFAGAVWPVLFQAGDDGLPAAIKNWAAARKNYNEDSPLIANLDSRHRAWRLFD